MKLLRSQAKVIKVFQDNHEVVSCLSSDVIVEEYEQEIRYTFDDLYFGGSSLPSDSGARRVVPEYLNTSKKTYKLL